MESISKLDKLDTENCNLESRRKLDLKNSTYTRWEETNNGKEAEWEEKNGKQIHIKNRLYYASISTIF